MDFRENVLYLDQTRPVVTQATYVGILNHKQRIIKRT
jgi:hypothetical protein